MLIEGKEINYNQVLRRLMYVLALFSNSNGSTALIKLLSEDNNPWLEVYIGLCLYVKKSLYLIDRFNDVVKLKKNMV